MNILFLSQVLPYPLDAGPKIRIYYVLRYLAQRHDVSLVSFTREGDEKAVPHLESICRQVHRVPLRRTKFRDAVHLAQSWLQGESFLIQRDKVLEMHETVTRLLSQQRFDFVHADQLAMATYALPVSQPKVLDEHNAVWTIVKRLWQNEPSRVLRPVLEREWRKLARYEAQVIRQFDQVVTVTPEDRAALENLDAAGAANLPRPIRVIPICIDPSEIPLVQRAPEPQNIVCVGGMFYPPNVDGMLWFASEVLPLVLRERPTTRFFVVGARPDRRLVALARRNPHVIVTGRVEEITPYLVESAAFIVPLRAGGGMRVKILDAWARGIPIVTTTIGCEGIETRPGENLLIADGPAEFAAAVVSLLRDSARGRQMARAGRRWVEEHYDWRRVYARFDTIYQ